MRITVFLVLISMLISLNSISNMSEISIITGQDPYSTEYSNYGYCIDIDGDYAVVGAPYSENGTGNAIGAVFVYHWDGSQWTQQNKLTLPNPGYGLNFGESVAISGDCIVAGCAGYRSNGELSGAAYVYHRSGTSWSYQAILYPSSVQPYDYFGRTVDISGDYVIAGAQQHDHNGMDDTGAAYIFHRSGTFWTEQSKLTASDASEYSYIGKAVAISGDYCTVTTEHLNKAYVYQRVSSTWSQLQIITGTGMLAADTFGKSVTMQGVYTLVGGTYYNGMEGVVYTFHRGTTTYSEEGKLHPSNGSIEGSFGFSISLSGDKALVGQYANSEVADYAGSAYVFERSGTTWNEVQQLFGSQIGEYDNFGWGAAISGDKALVGATQDEGDQPYSGAVYSYSLTSTIANTSVPDNDQSLQQLPGANTEFQFTTNHAATDITVSMFGHTPSVAGSLPAGVQTISADTYWQVFSSAGNVGNYNITFDLTGVSGIESFNTLKILKRDNSSGEWQDVTLAPHNASLLYNNPYITVQGLSSFSDFVPAGTGDNPLPVELSSFTGAFRDSKVTISWETSSETDNNGFNIFRSENTEFSASTTINPWVIAAVNSSSGGSYSFDDNDIEMNKTYYYWLESLSLDGNSILHRSISVTTSKSDGEIIPELPQTTLLHDAYPNPFNPETTIEFSVKENESATLTIMNVKGQTVKSFPIFNSGIHQVTWDGTNNNSKPISSGTYFYILQSLTSRQCKKMILIK